jgi:lipoprotein signal peptidase
MWIENTWFMRIGEYIGYWPGMLLLAVMYVTGVTMALLHYKSWLKKGLYIIALTVSMLVLWNVLELVVLY